MRSYPVLYCGEISWPSKSGLFWEPWACNHADAKNSHERRSPFYAAGIQDPVILGGLGGVAGTDILIGAQPGEHTVQP